LNTKNYGRLANLYTKYNHKRPKNILQSD